jgi:hypothetical protein
MLVDFGSMAISLFACIEWSLKPDTGDSVERFARAATAAVEERQPRALATVWRSRHASSAPLQGRG